MIKESRGMSFQAVQWALDEAPMLRTAKGHPDTTARAVLVARAERADEHGIDTHAGIEEIIWRTGYDERTIQRAEARLEKAGLLVRDGTSRWGTPRWNLDMSQKRDESERDEISRAIDQRRSANADRERNRRAAIKRRVDSASTRADLNDTRVDSPSARVDSDAARVDAAPPEPPHHPTTPEPPDEPPPGGTLPPDPLRPQDPKTGDLGNGIESSPSPAAQEPPQSPSATTDRAREEKPALHVIAGNPDAVRDPDSPSSLFPAPVPAEPAGHGFCLPCHAQGQYVVAADPVTGSRCTTHLRSA